MTLGQFLQVVGFLALSMWAGWLFAHTNPSGKTFLSVLDALMVVVSYVIMVASLICAAILMFFGA